MLSQSERQHHRRETLQSKAAQCFPSECMHLLQSDSHESREKGDHLVGQTGKRRYAPKVANQTLND